MAPATWRVAGSPGWRDGWYSHVASGGGADRCQAIAIGRTSALPSGETTSMWVAVLPFPSSQASRLSMAVTAFEISPARCATRPVGMSVAIPSLAVAHQAQKRARRSSSPSSEVPRRRNRMRAA